MTPPQSLRDSSPSEGEPRGGFMLPRALMLSVAKHPVKPTRVQSGVMQPRALMLSVAKHPV